MPTPDDYRSVDLGRGNVGGSELTNTGEDDPRNRQDREVEQALADADDLQLFLGNSLQTPGARVYHGQHRTNEMDDTNIDVHPGQKE